METEGGLGHRTQDAEGARSTQRDSEAKIKTLVELHTLVTHSASWPAPLPLGEGCSGVSPAGSLLGWKKEWLLCGLYVSLVP